MLVGDFGGLTPASLLVSLDLRPENLRLTPVPGDHLDFDCYSNRLCGSSNHHPFLRSPQCIDRPRLRLRCSRDPDSYSWHLLKDCTDHVRT